MTEPITFLRLAERELNALRFKQIRHLSVYQDLTRRFNQLALLMRDTPRQFELSYKPLAIEDESLSVFVADLSRAFDPIRSILDGVWLHGSLATQDFTNYSDVDALIMLKPESLTDYETFIYVRKVIKRALRLILMFDPLQHHGFFIGFTNVLAVWPANYLPRAVLQHARPLWQRETPLILYEHHDPVESLAAFQRLVHAICQASLPQTLYEAKLLLSQFMLLPALYCQALGQPMYKRESFTHVQPEFASFWLPMDEATQIRANWQIPPTRPLWSLLLKITNPWLASRIYRPLERRLPVCSHYPNWQGFLKEMQQLAGQMSARIGHPVCKYLP